MSEHQDIRWKQRFNNFDRAFVLLRSAMEHGPAALNQLEKEGVTRRFGCCFDLAWKTTRDFMEAGAAALAIATPRDVLNQAFAAKILKDGRVWADMLAQRTQIAHTCDQARFEAAVDAIHQRYLAAMGELDDFMHREAVS